MRLVSLFLLIVFLANACTSAEPVLLDMPPPQQETLFVDAAAIDTTLSVLVFSRTTGFRHASIEAGIAAVQQLGDAHGFAVDATEDGALFTPEILQKYDAVVFMNTNGIDVLNAEQKAAFERYIQQGGGYVGVHSATATEYEWPWYGELVGAYFDKHPQPQEAEVLVLDRNHPSTAHLPARWKRFDEWYNFRSNPRGNVHILAVLNEKSYEGGTMNYDHPIVWAQEYDGGRAWYTALGHTEEAYADADFRMHLLGGIEWAAGRVEGNVDATLTKSYRKVVLMDEVTDPMEIDIAADGRVFLAERAGAVKMWDPETGQTKDVGWIPVYMVIEDGLLGLKLDPNFMENGWLYVFYAPADAGPSRLSRFTIVDDQLDLNSEKVLLVVDVQRESCCHAGGSIAFDPAGNLYLSTGDNTDPSDREGSPIDERPGHKYADAQRTSGSTNDLRGKILRIHPEPDGTYTIPEGNLFEADDLHRPEIYTMGHRNPFRISVDAETGWLYWGDVGNGDPVNARGGWGWDEFNRAKNAGNYGWPYFTGNNQPYNDYDYATETIGEPFKPSAPINDSPNNTGARELPPAQPALIWYTYGATDAFPTLGQGGINPMAGPVYHKDLAHGPTALPVYFDDTLIIYEWMRNWVKEVKFDEQGEILHISPFLPEMELVRPTDMEIGPEGALYVIEWGDTFWGSNANAQVVRIAYTPDHVPEVTTLPASIQTTRVAFDTPRPGSFFSFDEPLDYRVTITDPAGRQLENHPVTVHVYSGFDTHKILLDAQSEKAGEATITRAFTHTPDLHFMDRFAELEACVTNKNGLQYCDRVKLHPRQKEAEHFAGQQHTTRQIYGADPASAPYAQTALAAVKVEAGSSLTYAPINLTGISALTFRLKHYEPGEIILRANTTGGPILGRVALDGANLVTIPQTRQGAFIDQATAYDEVLQAVNPEVYKNWSEVSVPLAIRDDVEALVLTFEGESDKTLLELDWLRFE